MAVIEIKVYFDTICAWCYIGHRTLYQAISLFQKTYPNASVDEFRVQFLPFYRDRTLPDVAVPLEERLVSSLGEDQTQNMRTKVERIARSHGIMINLQSRIGSTRKSQRLIYHAGMVGGEEGKRKVIEEIYWRWFEVGGDITSNDFLLECARGAGLEENAAREVLESVKYGDDVDALDRKAREEEGVRCVPTFMVNGGERIEGAEDVQRFYEEFVRVRERDTEGLREQIDR